MRRLSPRALAPPPGFRTAALLRAHDEAVRARRARAAIGAVLVALAVLASGLAAEVDPGRLLGNLGAIGDYFGRLAVFDATAPVELRGRSVLSAPAEWFWRAPLWLARLGDTVLIAYVGTVLGALLAGWLALASARNLAPNPASRGAARLVAVGLGAALLLALADSALRALGSGDRAALAPPASWALVGLALVFAWGAARACPRPLERGIAARTLEVARTVPDLVFALVFVFAFGVGPLAGVLAIALHTAGALGKLWAELIEAADMGAVDGVAATGAGFLPLVRFGVLPQALPGLLGVALLRFEINVRGAAVLGFVGAGGIGQDLMEAIRKFYYPDVSALLVLLIGTVILLDILTGRLRRALLGREGFRVGVPA